MNQNNLVLRPYGPDDLTELLNLFCETVHRVNAADYTLAQLNAWAPETPDWAQWNSSLQAHDSLVAWMDGRIAGFGDLDASGYLDRLYVRWDLQDRGVGTALCDALEAHAKALGCPAVTTHASITAKPFFLARGYILLRSQQVERAGERLTNYVLKKLL